MIKVFTPEYIRNNRGCYNKKQIDTLKGIVKKEITINDILDSEVSIKDKFWFLFNKCELSIRQKQEISIICAKVSLKIYEDKYKDDKRPRNAIKAASDYLNSRITKEELLVFRNAAYAAAAYAAYAAAADAAADAYAADAAADAAAYAAVAYADAYAAADAAADADAYADAYAAAADAAADAYAAAAIRKTSNKDTFEQNLIKKLKEYLNKQK